MYKLKSSLKLMMRAYLTISNDDDDDEDGYFNNLSAF